MWLKIHLLLDGGFCLFNNWFWGSGGGSVGRAVASDSRGPRFESSHQQKFISNIYCQLYWKDENKEKEAGNCPFFNNWFDFLGNWMQNRTYKIAHVNLPQGLDEISIKPTEWNNQNFIFIQNFKFCWSLNFLCQNVGMILPLCK